VRGRVVVGGCLLAIAFRSGGFAAEPEVVTGRLRASEAEAVVTLTIAPGWHVNAHAPRDAFLVPTTVELAPPAGVRAGAVRYPQAVERRLAFSGDRMLLLYEGTIELAAPLAGEPAPGALALAASVRYQACDEKRCLQPRTLRLTAAATAADAAGALDAGGDVAGWVARFGWAATFLWVLVLGVALNLTPCVYPLISVTLAFFGGRSGTESRHVVRNALLYVAGICVTFSALGAAAALTGSLFGAALQRPAVLGTIAAVMVALALGNFGLYQVRLPPAVMRWAGQTGEGGVGAFFMGLTMGVVAAPCIGPVVVGLLLFVGTRQSAPLGLALFFTLGLGMGLPYVGLATLAGHLRRLPRGGAWLVWMERLFAFVLLGIALHFATSLLPAAWVRLGWALLIAAGGVVLGFLGSNVRPAVRRARAAGGVVALAIALGTLLIAEAGSPIAWTEFSDEALGRALAAGRPVLIDFEAEWCLPCREMDRTTFRDPEVVRAAAGFATLKVDATAGDERVSALLARYRVPGVPTYVLLGPDGIERKRFVGYVPAAEMQRAMDAVLPDNG
jgi:thiol:disulfide interchange protein DsbD